MRWILTIGLFVLFAFSHSTPTLSQSEPNFLTIRHTERVTYAQWSADSGRILTTSEDGTIRMSDSQTGEILWERSEGNPIVGASWSPDESFIIAWGTDDRTVLIDAQTGDVTDRSNSPIQNAIWKADSTAVMMYSQNILNVIAIQDGRFGGGLFALETPDTILSAGWSADETQILTFHESRNATIWDVTTNDKIGDYRFPEETTGIAWSANGDRFASWGQESIVTLWDISPTGRILSMRDFRHNRTFVIGVQWAMDDMQLLTWGADETARIWDVTSGTELVSVYHTDWVTGATLNQEGTRLVTWSYQSAYIWNAQTGDLLYQAPHDNLVSGASLNADETRLLTWGWDGTARIWGVEG
ncbi:MAG: hypothetical protein KJ043_06955 [Anaerolineae bacterium]|nr:hypothetical protein [Anaerolineae bacterium]